MLCLLEHYTGTFDPAGPNPEPHIFKVLYDRTLQSSVRNSVQYGYYTGRLHLFSNVVNPVSWVLT